MVDSCLQGSRQHSRRGLSSPLLPEVASALARSERKRDLGLFLLPLPPRTSAPPGRGATATVTASHCPTSEATRTGSLSTGGGLQLLRAEILREFTLHAHVREEAQNFLRGLRVNGNRPSTYVGVHVRRGDYVHVMPNVWKGVVADRRYLEQALDWFRARYSAPIFVVSSNGMAWCRENINASRGDVVFAGNGNEGSPAKDFALLTQCNHTIMTIGTFGIWAAYLAGGETIYLANYTLPDSPFLKVFKPEAAFLPEWIGIPADLSPLLKH